MLNQIHSQLHRLDASGITASLDEQFEPRAGTLVKVELKGAYWHLLPEQFLDLLNRLPDAAGSEAIRIAIETEAPLTWHGPAPNGSRDTP